MNKMTKLAVLPLVMTLGVGFASTASAANDCNAKRAAIENQIKQAEKYGNYNKIAGLKRALSEVNAHCTSGSVLQDAQKKVSKLESKLRDKQDDVREVQADLRQAQASGDAKKVAKYQRKLQEKQADVNQINEELRQARAEVAALSK
jgi:peptidoglycan hydrolase CwlO-like protein